MAISAKMLGDWNIEALATVVTSAPNSGFPVVNLYCPHHFMALWAHILVPLTEVRLQIHIPTLNMLHQGTLLDIKGLAEGATVAEGDVWRSAFWAKNNFVVECLFKDSGGVEFA